MRIASAVTAAFLSAALTVPVLAQHAPPQGSAPPQGPAGSQDIIAQSDGLTLDPTPFSAP